jgi:hypothetical protein
MHQLITLAPLARVTKSPDGVHPPRRSIGDPAGWTAPPGHAYVPVIPASDVTYDPATQRIERELTATTDGWQVIDLAPGEIAELAAKQTESASDAVELLAVRSILLDLKNGTGTAGERITRVERVLFAIAKRTLSL